MMGLWKITSKGPLKVAESSAKQEKLLEENLEDWIAQDPSTLGEPLLIVGRQVVIADVKDRLDLLAIDQRGNATIIELKKGKLKDPVDMQALRYASYISKWRFEDFESTMRNYLGKVGDPEYNFNSIFESFCEDAGVDEIPDLNKNQRIIIVGSAVREKLGSVALWLYDQGIEIKIIEVQIYKDGEDILIEPNTVVPLQVSKFADTGRTKPGKSPWIDDGKSWHLEKRCSPKTKQMLNIIDDIIKQNFDVDGPNWDQKHYVSYRINNYNWLAIITAQNYIRLDFLVKAKAFNVDEVASRLGLKKFDKEETLAEKFGYPSSIFIKNRNEGTDRVSIRVKDNEFDLQSEKFLDYLKEAYKAFPK